MTRQNSDVKNRIFCLRPYLFSFTSRSPLVRPSFVSRCSLVRYSLVYRRPIENRTRNKRKTNERATNVGRETIENSTSSHRHGWLMAGKVPFSNHKPEKCLLPQTCRGRILHFLSHTEHFLGE